MAIDSLLSPMSAPLASESRSRIMLLPWWLPWWLSLVLVVAVLKLSVRQSGASELSGPYDISISTTSAERDFVCGGRELFVAHPESGRPGRSFPIVVYMHGVGGLEHAVLPGVASFGFVVVAPNNVPQAASCRSQVFWQDALLSLESRSAIDKLLAQGGAEANWEQLGIWGRSMGGKTVPHAVSESGRDFKAAVLQNGARNSSWIDIPSLYLTATEDHSSSPPSTVLDEYRSNRADDKILLNVAGQGHMLSPKKEAIVDAVIGRFFLCHLEASMTDCDYLYAEKGRRLQQGLQGAGSLCANGFMESCYVTSKWRPPLI